jgi:hypothetical protein
MQICSTVRELDVNVPSGEILNRVGMWTFSAFLIGTLMRMVGIGLAGGFKIDSLLSLIGGSLMILFAPVFELALVVREIIQRSNK